MNKTPVNLKFLQRMSGASGIKTSWIGENRICLLTLRTFPIHQCLWVWNCDIWNQWIYLCKAIHNSPAWITDSFFGEIPLLNYLFVEVIGGKPMKTRVPPISQLCFPCATPPRKMIWGNNNAGCHFRCLKALVATYLQVIWRGCPNVAPSIGTKVQISAKKIIFTASTHRNIESILRSTNIVGWKIHHFGWFAPRKNGEIFQPASCSEKPESRLLEPKILRFLVGELDFLTPYTCVFADTDGTECWNEQRKIAEMPRIPCHPSKIKACVGFRESKTQKNVTTLFHWKWIDKERDVNKTSHHCHLCWRFVSLTSHPMKASSNPANVWSQKPLEKS